LNVLTTQNELKKPSPKKFSLEPVTYQQLTQHIAVAVVVIKCQETFVDSVPFCDRFRLTNAELFPGNDHVPLECGFAIHFIQAIIILVSSISCGDNIGQHILWDNVECRNLKLRLSEASERLKSTIDRVSREIELFRRKIFYFLVHFPGLIYYQGD
jgi:hypothetical protein